MERQRAQRQAVPPNVMQSGLHWYPKPWPWLNVSKAPHAFELVFTPSML
jgi:hypothetical protein